MSADGTANALDAIHQIRLVANYFEGKRLPLTAVGAIEGYCNRIERQLIEAEKPDQGDPQ